MELLNGTLANDLAESFAERISRDAGMDTNQQIDRAYQLVAGRMPTPTELRLARDFLAKSPLHEFCRALFNLNEFVYVE